MTESRIFQTCSHQKPMPALLYLLVRSWLSSGSGVSPAMSPSALSSDSYKTKEILKNHSGTCQYTTVGALIKNGGYTGISKGHP